MHGMTDTTNERAVLALVPKQVTWDVDAARAHRVAAGITQNDVALALGVQAQMVTAWEKGRPTTLALARAYAAAIGMVGELVQADAAVAA